MASGPFDEGRVIERERTLYLSAGAEMLLITSERCGTFTHWRDSLSLLVSPQQIIRVIDRSHSVSGSTVAAAGAITLAAAEVEEGEEEEVKVRNLGSANDLAEPTWKTLSSRLGVRSKNIKEG